MVRSKGVEAEVNKKLLIERTKINFSGRYSYTSATNLKVKQGDENTLFKQRVYVPKHNAQVELSCEWHRYFFTYQQSFTGKRYTSGENSELYALKPFCIGNLNVSKSYNTSRTVLEFNLQVNNIYNSAYQVIAYTPMLGRNFTIGTKINFKQNK